MNKSSVLITGIILAFSALPVSSNNDFKINGFINVIGSISDSETPYLEVITDNGSFGDTNIGITLTKKINSKTTIATQFFGKHENFIFDWGFISYKVDSDLFIKAGKIKYPGNLVSETLDVGSTYPWVRAPVAIYGEAARLSYEAYTGSSLFYTTGDDIEYTAEFFIGETDGEAASNERMIGMVLSATTDYIRFQASFNNSVMVLNNFDPTNPNQILMNDKSMNNFAIGMKAEYDIATIFAEYAITTMPQNLENTGWYITAMHTMDKWTPHITYQSYEGMFGREETSISLGINRKLDLSTVIKFELQSIDPTSGGFFEEQPDDNTVNLFNISVNMVF